MFVCLFEAFVWLFEDLDRFYIPTHSLTTYLWLPSSLLTTFPFRPFLDSVQTSLITINHICCSTYVFVCPYLHSFACPSKCITASLHNFVPIEMHYYFITYLHSHSKCIMIPLHIVALFQPCISLHHFNFTFRCIIFSLCAWLCPHRNSLFQLGYDLYHFTLCTFHCFNLVLK